jgi:hypothetical protein
MPVAAPAPATPDSGEPPVKPAVRLADSAATGPAPTVKSARIPAEQKHHARTGRNDTARVHAPAKSTLALRASTRQPARAAAKAKKTSASKPATQAPVDSDVALISAVIQHANNQRAASDAAAKCDADEACATKATPEP